MDSQTPHILVKPGVVTEIRFNRPEKKNAITGSMYRALHNALQAAGADDKVRAVILRGTDDCFCAGNDIADLAAAIDTQEPAAGEFMQSLAEIDKPLVAAVSGPAIGIGTTLLLHCDFVYADDTAVFRTPFTALGVCPEAGSSFLLVERVGHVRAAEMLLLSEQVDAQRAQEIGLINRMVPTASLYGEAEKTAKQLAEMSAISVRSSKRLMRHHLSGASMEAFNREIQSFSSLLQSEEAQQAFAAFFSKGK